MADLQANEKELYTKYYGDTDLINNDKFWLDVLILYQDKVIALPYTYEPVSVRRVQKRLNCPPGKCALCCRYEKVNISDDDLREMCGETREFLVKEDGIWTLPSKDGCPFLKDNICLIYDHRPDSCWLYPIQGCRDIDDKGTIKKQMLYRIKCPASIDVVRQVFREVLSEKYIILPDLTWVEKKESNEGNKMG